MELPSVTHLHIARVIASLILPSPCRGSWTTHDRVLPGGVWTREGTPLTLGTSHVLQHALLQRPLLPHPRPLLLAINASFPTSPTKPGIVLCGRYVTGARIRDINPTHVATLTPVVGPTTFAQSPLLTPTITLRGVVIGISVVLMSPPHDTTAPIPSMHLQRLTTPLRPPTLMTAPSTVMTGKIEAWIASIKRGGDAMIWTDYSFSFSFLLTFDSYSWLRLMPLLNHRARLILLL